MIDWKAWAIDQWNDRLLEHFFRNQDDDPPVSVLLVTPEEIAKATGDASVVADDARAAFIDAVRRGTATRTLLDHASNYRGWPEHPPLGRPKFVAHLILTCLAASESSDELADESSYILRLRNLVDVPEGSLHMLPGLWTQLSKWLSQHDGSYRRLILPDPGGFTRIGYTVKLTFPDRRDQQHLSELLDEAGLAGMVPPTGRVVSVVAAERNKFGPAFRLAFDDFKRRFEGNASQRGTLSLHRFWAAVSDAALRGRGLGELHSGSRFTLLAEESDDALSIFVACDRGRSMGGIEAISLFAACGRWQFGLVPQGQTFESGGLASLVASALLRRIRLPRVSSFIDQGVLPFALGAHGVLELVDRDQVAAATHVLVRQELAKDLLHFFPTGAIRASPYDGWVEVTDPRLHTAPSAKFVGSTLETAWILQESLSQPRVGYKGGVRTEEGWLGVSEVLPAVIADSVKSIALISEAGRTELTKDAANLWHFPRQDWEGQFDLVASFDQQEVRRRIRFDSTTSSEAFKEPRDPCAWIVESLCGTATMASTLAEEYGAAASEEEIAVDEPLFLGPGIGEFVSDHASAAWEIRSIGRKTTGRRGGLRGDAALPSFRVDSANARRRWTNLVLKSDVDQSDPDFGVARRRVNGIVASGSQLPSRSIEQSVPKLTPRSFESPLPSVSRLVRVVAGRAGSRAGLTWSEWRDLTTSILRIDAKQLGHVTRAWSEAGFVDVASNARWRNRTVFARSPRLLAYRTGGLVNAVISGLVLPITQDAIRDTAARDELLLLDRNSVCGLVPPVLRVVGNDQKAITELAKRFGFPIAWLSDSALRKTDCSLGEQDDPPAQYEFAGEWSLWSLRREPRSEVRVEHYCRPDRPDYWIAKHGDASFWSYEINAIRVWAARRLGEALVTPSGVDDLVANHAYLPLTLARVVSVLGQGLSGPTGSGEYRYPVGARLRAKVIAALT